MSEKVIGLAGGELPISAFECHRLTATPLQPEGFSIYKSYVAEREQETTGRSGFKFKRLTPTPIRPVVTYKSYYRREEIKIQQVGVV